MSDKQVRMPGANDIATDMINRWLRVSRGLPNTLQLTKLGFAVVAELESAYQAGFEAALKAGEEKR